MSFFIANTMKVVFAPSDAIITASLCMLSDNGIMKITIVANTHWKTYFSEHYEFFVYFY